MRACRINFRAFSEGDPSERSSVEGEVWVDARNAARAQEIFRAWLELAGISNLSAHEYHCSIEQVPPGRPMIDDSVLD
jgi:hypothetical protein